MEEQKESTEAVAQDSAQSTPSEQQAPVENQETKTSESGSQEASAPDQPSGQEQPKQEQYEFKGNWSELSDKAPQLEPYAKSVRRYLTQETEKNADEKKLAEKYRLLEQDPDLKSFYDWKNRSRTYGASPQPQAAYTPPDVYGDAIDPETQKLLAEKERLFAQKFAQLEQRVNKVDRQADIQAFAEAHPDFWQLHKLGLLGPQLQKQEQAGKWNIAEAYTHAVDLRNQMKAAIRQEDQIQSTQRKNAVTAKPSVPSESNIEYVDTMKEVMDRSMQLASQNIKKQVKIRDKKKKII